MADQFPAHDPVRFPNTRRRGGAARPAPPSGPPTQPAVAAMPPPPDPDTCRICRGEGSLDEPLFFPCKCSGSIKYVHQDCLMEWLSHSQKKHCELCKTPFRFTKLYDPNMPRALPAHVFVRHTAKYLLRKLGLWLRAALVASVWLGWLPYLMRTVWSFLFWISDEGFGSRPTLFALDGTAAALDVLAQTAGVCPSSPLFATTTTAASLGGILDSLPPESARIVRSLYGINLTTSDPVYSVILRLLFGSAGSAEKPAAVNATAALARLSSNSTIHHSLLGDIGFLRNLTRHDAVNRIVIATLEGQIITVLVIVCFILIILVRDYVVQQQPELNMRAAFGAIDIPPPAVPPPEVPDPYAAEAVLVGEDVYNQPSPGNSGPEYSSSESDSDLELPRQSRPSAVELPPTVRPDAPADSVAAAPAQAWDRTTVHEYLDIYREAGGDPENILRIARERHLDVKLDYWMRLTRSMMDRHRDGGSPDAALAEATAAAALLDTPSGGQPDALPDTVDGREGASKGKARLVETAEEPPSPLVASPQRPRANTDGPPISGGIHPLANNNWSFPGLPPEPFPPPAGPLHDAALRAAVESAWDSAAESSASAVPPPPSPLTPPDDFAMRQVTQDDAHLPREPAQPPEEPRHRGPAGLADRVADFMWREADSIPPDELAPINWLGDFGENALEEAGQEDVLDDQPEPDREAVEEAGLDAEAVEDAEDLEGILELLGMRGPVAGLLQNAIFCAFLVSITVFVGVFIPYNLGRIAIWAAANPARLAQILFSSFKLVQDCCALVLGFASSILSESVHALSRVLLPASVAARTRLVAGASWQMVGGAASRISAGFLAELPRLSSSEVRTFSALSHEALLVIKARVALATSTIWEVLAVVVGGDYSTSGPEVLTMAAKVSAAAWEGLRALPAAAVTPSAWVINLSLPEPAQAVVPELATWGGADRFWAITAGYAAVSAMAGLYLRRGIPFSTTRAAQEWEASLIDGLSQASGVMKVILIISIEMLVFPLYCGMLLDVALLPLFEGATLGSRLRFAAGYPVTSVFVHWFVGTGYMFHFALFVSMCRKIMRKGVLYFIRDPDDPDFHPVRDVLERTVTTQLRKILFSAFVYGALVMVCLGGVVWGLALALPGVLPVHYSSNEPVLEFPVDLLFYNFLMPLAVRFFRPGDGLHAMYTWWFRRCARALRITWFLFGERRVDEEGRLVLPANSPDRALPPWRRWFLELNDDYQVVARSWRGIFEGGTRRAGKEGTANWHVRKMKLVRAGHLVPDGRFVRTPASDQVKIPKGSGVFLAVDDENRRPGPPGEPPQSDDFVDIYSTRQYQFVYLPPHFRVRVFVFIMSIWAFAAVTGVSITIVPLVFGRWMFRRLIPGHIRTNDIYAFSIGIHVLGSAAYALVRAPSVCRAARARVGPVLQRDTIVRGAAGAVRAARVIYTYFFGLAVFPLLLASLMELYVLIPLHELMYSALLREHTAAVLTPEAAAERLNPVHTIRVVQAWTIGLLYLRLGLRITNTWFEGSHVSNAARAVLRRGWLDPDVSIFTRAFVVPGLALWLAAVAAPLALARVLATDGMVDGLVAEFAGFLAGRVPEPVLRDAYLVLLHRLSFPLTALLVGCGVGLWGLVGVFRRWQVRIRDEAYLIGERLHNFAGTTGAPRARGGWRSSGARI